MGIKVYGAPWCADCRRSKRLLDECRVDYEWIDISKDNDAARFVQNMNSGRHIIPTIVFPEGSFLAEPTDDELIRDLVLFTEWSKSRGV